MINGGSGDPANGISATVRSEPWKNISKIKYLFRRNDQSQAEIHLVAYSEICRCSLENPFFFFWQFENRSYITSCHFYPVQWFLIIVRAIKYFAKR